MVAFITDTYAPRIVGWRVSSIPRARFAPDAFEQAVHGRRLVKAVGQVQDNDRGSQYLSSKYTERLAAAGIDLSRFSAVDTIWTSQIKFPSGKRNCVGRPAAALSGQFGGLWVGRYLEDALLEVATTASVAECAKRCVRPYRRRG